MSLQYMHRLTDPLEAKRCLDRSFSNVSEEIRNKLVENYLERNKCVQDLVDHGSELGIGGSEVSTVQDDKFSRVVSEGGCNEQSDSEYDDELEQGNNEAGCGKKRTEGTIGLVEFLRESRVDDTLLPRPLAIAKLAKPPSIKDWDLKPDSKKRKPLPASLKIFEKASPKRTKSMYSELQRRVSQKISSLTNLENLGRRRSVRSYHTTKLGPENTDLKIATSPKDEMDSSFFCEMAEKTTERSTDRLTIHMSETTRQSAQPAFEKDQILPISLPVTSSHTTMECIKSSSVGNNEIGGQHHNPVTGSPKQIGILLHPSRPFAFEPNKGNGFQPLSSPLSANLTVSTLTSPTLIQPLSPSEEKSKAKTLPRNLMKRLSTGNMDFRIPSFARSTVASRNRARTVSETAPLVHSIREPRLVQEPHVVREPCITRDPRAFHPRALSARPVPATILLQETADSLFKMTEVPDAMAPSRKSLEEINALYGTPTLKRKKQKVHRPISDFVLRGW